jgi:hypothetical protein
MSDRNCVDCRFHISEDYGYSSYTVEGTVFHCAKKLHPDDSFDEFYGDDKRLEYAKECNGFETGVGIWMDVECENESALTPAQREVYGMWIKSNG